MNMISCGVEIAIVEVERRWFVRICGQFSVSFFSFLISCVICFRYKKPYAARAMKRKKPLSQNNRPLPCVGKIQDPGNHRKSPLHLAPKILILQTGKKTIHRNLQVESPKPFGRLPRTKESFAKASKGGPEGQDSHRAFL